MCLCAHPRAHMLSACSKCGSFTAKPQLFFTHTLLFVCPLTKCTCACQRCPQCCECMKEANFNLTVFIRKCKTEIVGGIPRGRCAPTLLGDVDDDEEMFSCPPCVVSSHCFSQFVLLLPLSCVYFALCNCRTPTTLSVLILTLSGRYSNEFSPLDSSVNSAWAGSIQRLCFPLCPLWIPFLVGVQRRRVQDFMFQRFWAAAFITRIPIVFFCIFIGFVLFLFLWVMFSFSTLCSRKR